MSLPEVEASDDVAHAILADSLAQHVEARLRFTGDCMRPVLAPGDSVTLAAPRRRLPRMGDVVLVRTSEGLRLHRLIWGPPLARRRWRTMADTATKLDPWWIRPEDVLGVVVMREGRPLKNGSWHAIRSLCRSLRS